MIIWFPRQQQVGRQASFPKAFAQHVLAMAAACACGHTSACELQSLSNNSRPSAAGARARVSAAARHDCPAGDALVVPANVYAGHSAGKLSCSMCMCMSVRMCLLACSGISTCSARTCECTRTRKRAHVRTRTHARTHIHTRSHAHMHKRANTDTHTHARAHTHRHTRAGARAHARTLARAQAHNTHACMHARTHACTHAHTRARARARARDSPWWVTSVCRTHLHHPQPPRHTLFLPGGAAVTWRVHICTRASAHTHMDMHSKQKGRHCTRARVLALSVRTRLPPRLLPSLQSKACRRSHRQK